MGYRFSVFVEPRGSAAGGKLWAHGVYGNIDVDRSDDEELHYFADQCSASAREGKCDCVAIESGDGGGGGSAVDCRARKKRLRWESITGYNEAQSAARRMSTRNGSVKNGIDVLEEHGFDVLQVAGGKKTIGLVTNQTGVDAEGRRTIDVLAQLREYRSRRFSVRSTELPGRWTRPTFSDSKDAATGVPVYSVYGATDAARRPSADVMKQLDAVVFDIQDAGARFYTYETTLGYFLEAAARRELR